jgi:hypothetical protein
MICERELAKAGVGRGSSDGHGCALESCGVGYGVEGASSSPSVVPDRAYREFVIRTVESGSAVAAAAAILGPHHRSYCCTRSVSSRLGLDRWDAPGTVVCIFASSRASCRSVHRFQIAGSTVDIRSLPHDLGQPTAAISPGRITHVHVMDPTATPPPGAQRSRTHYLGRMERSLSSDTRRYRVQSSSVSRDQLEVAKKLGGAHSV